MIVGRVTGNVVSSVKSEKLRNAKLLIVQTVDISSMKIGDDYQIMIDDVGAGIGDLVFGAYGSSSRQSDTSREFASDYTIYGIIDSIDLRGKRTYDKAKEADPCSWQKSSEA